MGIGYRREVDGLRAVAVVPVVLFHAGFQQLSGGYAGVDVFFVISGFLITSIILAERDAAKFTVLGFYERRARRILPALFTVLLVSLIAAWICLVPGAFKNFGKSLIATSAFGSNFLFWKQSGYFAPAAEDIPLLHTWSLAVEEQYYLLFPLFLMLLAPVRRNRLALVIAGIAIVSLVFSEWAWRHAPSANFYLLPSRAWELMVGALLAVALLQRDIRSYVGAPARNVLSLVGIALIAGAFLIFNKDTPFPSVYAVIPVVGTALILATATSDTLVGRVLASPPLVFVGLISYSVYLWHVPLLSFAHALLLDPPSFAVRLALIAATFVLAYATWRFVETPFRRRHVLGRRTILTSAVVVSLAFAAGGFAIVANDGFRARFKSYYITFDVDGERAKSWTYVNHRDDGKDHRDGPLSKALTTGALGHSSRLRVAVVGNSHAKDMYNMLYLSGLDISLEPIITNYSCHGLRKYSARWKACNYEYIFHPNMRWNADRYVIAPQWDEGRIAELPRVLDHLNALGKRVAVFGNTAEFQDVPQYFAKSIGRGGDDSIPNLRRIERRAAATLQTEKLREMNRRIREIAEQHGASYFDRISLLCPHGHCTLLDDHLRYVLYDYGHLTLGGAKYVGKRLLQNHRFMSFLGIVEARNGAN